MPWEPFAVHLYREHLRGKTIQQLAEEFQIPVARIAQRVQAAADYAASRRVLIRFPAGSVYGVPN